MKKIFSLFLIISILIGNSVSLAQDIIKLKNGKEFNAQVILVTHNKVKYKKFENLDGPTLRFKLNHIQSIQYETGETDLFDSLSYQEGEKRVKSFRSSINPSAGYLQGYQDGRNQFCNYQSAATATFFITLVAGGIPGLAPAIGFSSVSPKLELIQVSTKDSADYVNGYIAGAKSKKSSRVWKNWGIAYGVRSAVYVGTIVIAAVILPLL